MAQWEVILYLILSLLWVLRLWWIAIFSFIDQLLWGFLDCLWVATSTVDINNLTEICHFFNMFFVFLWMTYLAFKYQNHKVLKALMVKMKWSEERNLFYSQKMVMEIFQCVLFLFLELKNTILDISIEMSWYCHEKS